MFVYEIKKTIFKQRGLIILLFFISLKVVFNIYNLNNLKNKELYKSQKYFEYIEEFSGKVTKEKKNKIENEYRLVSEAHSSLDKAIEDFRENKISKEKFEKVRLESYERINNKNSFLAIFKKYSYANENPEKRYILEDSGWIELLSKRNPDFLMILTILIFTAIIFSIEFGNSMYLLLLSTVNGKYKLIKIKIIFAMVVAILVIGIFSFIDYITIKEILGLDNGTYPIQSLKYFENSSYSLSLLSCYLLIVLCRILGAVMLVAITMIINILTKETIITLSSAFIITIIPFIMIKKSSLLYYLPLPAGLFSASGFFRGDVYESGLNSNFEPELIKEFQSISKENFIIILLIILLMIIAIIFISIRQYSKISIHNLKKNMKKSISYCYLFFLLSTVSLIFLGCEKNELKESNFSYEYYENIEEAKAENKDYIIELDIENNFIIATNKKDGEKFKINRELLNKDKNMKIRDVFIQGESCYYLEQIENEEGIRIYEVNMKNLEKKIIYSSINENNNDFFGINEIFKKEVTLSKQLITRFFVFNDYIYYEDGSSLVEINRKNNKLKIVIDDLRPSVSIVFKGKFIYYIDTNYNLSTYNIQSKQIQKFSDVYLDKFTVEGEQLKYKSLIDKKEYIQILK